MKYTEVTKFITKENLLTNNILKSPGIYAITIDNYIVYIGQSKNVYERATQHIYNTENATFNKEQKYLLLLSAKLGGHKVDVLGLEYLDPEVLSETEDKYIEKYNPCLNILTPYGKQDISKLKIEDVLNKLTWLINDIIPTYLGEYQTNQQEEKETLDKTN